MVLHLLTKLVHYEAFNQYSIAQKIRFKVFKDVKHIYRKIQYKQKFFGKFQGWSCFAKKIVLYSSTKFGILKPWINVLWPRFNHLEDSIYTFGRTENTFLGNSIRRRAFLKIANVRVVVPEKCFEFVNKIWHSKHLNQYSVAQKIRFRLFTNFKKKKQKKPPRHYRKIQ